MKYFILLFFILIQSSMAAQHIHRQEIPMAKKYEALFFDLDETLVEFDKAEKQSLNIVHETHYATSIDQEIFLHHYNTINKGLWAKFEKGEFALNKISEERFVRLHETL